MGVEVHARSIFLQGLLFLSKKKLIEMFPDVIQSINKIKEIAEANSLKISDLALLFVNDNIHIDKLVIGVNNIEQLNGDSDRGLAKIGLLTPISSELYLDTSFNYMFILDKDIREQDIELAEVGYISVGLSYFWKK